MAKFLSEGQHKIKLVYFCIKKIWSYLSLWTIIEKTESTLYSGALKLVKIKCLCILRLQLLGWDMTKFGCEEQKWRISIFCPKLEFFYHYFGTKCYFKLKVIDLSPIESHDIILGMFFFYLSACTNIEHLIIKGHFPHPGPSDTYVPMNE